MLRQTIYFPRVIFMFSLILADRSSSSSSSGSIFSNTENLSFGFDDFGPFFPFLEEGDDQEEIDNFDNNDSDNLDVVWDAFDSLSPFVSEGDDYQLEDVVVVPASSDDYPPDSLINDDNDNDNDDNDNDNDDFFAFDDTSTPSCLDDNNNNNNNNNKAAQANEFQRRGDSFCPSNPETPVIKNNAPQFPTEPDNIILPSVDVEEPPPTSPPLDLDREDTVNDLAAPAPALAPTTTARSAEFFCASSKYSRVDLRMGRMLVPVCGPGDMVYALLPQRGWPGYGVQGFYPVVEFSRMS